MAGDGLTVRQRKFAEEYVMTGNKYQSALAAGYTEKYAKSKSHELTALPGVALYIDKLRDELVKDVLRKDRLLMAYAAIAYADIEDFLTVENGRVKMRDTRDIPKSKRIAVTGIKQRKKSLEYKLGNKERAIETLIRIAGLMDRSGQSADVEDLTPLVELLSGADGKNGEICEE